MQLQYISYQFPNVISITKIREDIDSLTSLLEKYGTVSVLRGQEVLFEAVRPETEEEKKQRKLRAGESIMSAAKAYKYKRGEKSLTKILIEERDKMNSGSYEL